MIKRWTFLYFVADIYTLQSNQPIKSPLNEQQYTDSAVWLDGHSVALPEQLTYVREPNQTPFHYWQPVKLLLYWQPSTHNAETETRVILPGTRVPMLHTGTHTGRSTQTEAHKPQRTNRHTQAASLPTRSDYTTTDSDDERITQQACVRGRINTALWSTLLLTNSAQHMT